MIGQTVSHFEILERIGQGGMGVVYKARDLKLDRLVALKFLPAHLGGEEEAQRRFLREARTASALDHANICTIYQIGETPDGQTFIAMAYCDGETLTQRIARGPLPLDEVIRISEQIARGLAEAHARGIVHRDIKPGNIIITREGAVKILDFGLATLPGGTRITQAGSTSGTVAYMSPEQLRGDPLDTRTDIWSWGVVTYEMLTGRLPFPGDNTPSVILSIVSRNPKSISTDSPQARRLAAIIGRALSKEPSQRYPGAEELVSELGAAATSESPTLIMPVQPPSERGTGGFLRRRWPAVALALGAALAALAAWATWSAWRRPASSAPATTSPSTSVAVFPFRYRGSDQYRYLGEGMVDLLSAKLDGAGELRAIDPRAIAGLTAREGALDPERGRLAAERLNAQHFVLGSVVEIGGKVQIDATLYSVQSGRNAAAQTNASGQVANAFDVVDELAIGILAELGAGASARSTRVASVTTTSLPAFRAYLDGQSAFQRGDFRTSVEALQKAVELDKRFALAWYRLSVAREWLGTPQEAQTQAAEQAYLNADRLTDRDRRLLEASKVWRQGANREARRLYSEIVQTYPDEIEGWYQLGEVLFHRNGLYGASIAESRGPFERVLSLEPKHFASLVHLARIESLERRLDAMNSLVARILALGMETPERLLAIRALQAFALDDRQLESRVLEELSHSDGQTLAFAFLEVSLYAGSLPGTERIALLLTAPSLPPRVRSYGHVALAHLALARGKWAEAKRQLETVAGLDPWSSLEYRALFSSLPFLPASTAELSAIRDGLTALNPASVPRVENPAAFIDAHDDLHPLLRMYLMALVSSRMGDLDLARRYAGEIERQKFPPGFKTLAADLAASVHAQIDRRQGRPADALARLEPVLAETKNPLESPFVSEVYERFARGQLRNELGRYSEALGSFEHIAESSIFEFAYIPLSRFWRGEIRSRLGHTVEAAANYQAFIELWKDCDPELRPMLQLARQRLEGLASKESAPGKAGSP